MKTNIFKTLLFLALVFTPFLSHAQVATEKITSYHSDIQINTDSSLEVTETINVISVGKDIKHGIYRDFPIAYTDTSGKRYFVGFDILNITRDGKQEPYKTEKKGNGIRIYIGDKNTYVTTGPHEYTITYKTQRQLGYFKDHDELYWNVTGNGWYFPIDSASATVNLPETISKEKIQTYFYTGLFGSTEKNATAEIKNDGSINFQTTRSLNSNEGLTIVVSFPKGIVTPPTASQNFISIIWANLDYIVGIIGLILVFIYFFYFWNKVGRDPKKGTVVAQYEAPLKLSPASLRYIAKMNVDNKAFAASIVNLGVKGILSMKETKGFLSSTTYTLTLKDPEIKTKLSEEEEILRSEFFSTDSNFVLETKNSTRISKIVEVFSKSLKEQFGNKYFIKNTGTYVLGLVLSIATVISSIVAGKIVRFGNATGLQVLFWISFGLILLIFNIVFARLLKAYTIEGRKLVDEIEGFVLFLSVTEKDRLNFHQPPEQTPELFEKMLPYALALGVENKWAKQFTTVFDKLKKQGKDYAPAWYYGSSLHSFSPNTFADSVGKTFTGVVSSSATPPGTGSGSGGSSGGGGGGGGGGGW